MELRGSKSKYCDKVSFDSINKVEHMIGKLYKKHPTKRMRPYFCNIHKAYHITTGEGRQEIELE